jgi:hypothetical protein
MKIPAGKADPLVMRQRGADNVPIGLAPPEQR